MSVWSYLAKQINRYFGQNPAFSFNINIIIVDLIKRPGDIGAHNLHRSDTITLFWYIS